MGSWAGKRALIVEDDLIIAMMLEYMLEGLGCNVVASTAKLDAALSAATNTDCDFAIVDLNLAGKSAVPIVEVLKTRAIPCIISTGADPSGLPFDLREFPFLSKPYVSDELEAMLEQLFR